MSPFVGEYVRVEYLNIDEIEAICWLCDYSMLSYLDNFDMRLKLFHIGTKDMLFVKFIDYETGRIELSR